MPYLICHKNQTTNQSISAVRVYCVSAAKINDLVFYPFRSGGRLKKTY